MSSVAGRKKSIASANGLQIETPIAHNTFLNKAAAQSTSLYQQCAQLRARLLRVHDFPVYFSIASPSEMRSSTDPVTQLWDCFALGTPLCFLHDLLPDVTPISSINTDPIAVDPSDAKAIKKAIVHFAMAASKTDLVDQSDQFRATQLLDRSSTEGFVKVVNCVTRLVDRLPEDRFQELPPPSPPSISSHDSSDSLVNPDSPILSTPANAQDAARNNIIRELVETERKYVQDLEHMQKYANALSSSSAIDQDTIHLLFPGLNKLLDFQRRFLIKLEGSAELPWKEQRWGVHFTENEDEFAVYEPYCANYTHAVEILLLVEQNLMTVSLINAKSELPAFLIKPVQRICKYPLLLESLLKASSASEYPFYDELKAGSESAKRITDRINEAQRRAENLQTVKSLQSRVEDWKGHHLENFGDLLLDDIFMVTKMDIDREYHVFLFEKIILCCKEVHHAVAHGGNRKVNKSNSILKKQPTTPTSLPGGFGPPKKKDTPLLLKGRIFLNNVTKANPTSLNGQHSLRVWWRGDDDSEYFTLRCRTEEQLKQWEASINRLIKEASARRVPERNLRMVAHQANSTNPAPHARQYGSYDSSRTLSSASQLNYMNGVSMPNGSSSVGRRYVSSGPYNDVVSSGVSAGGFYIGNGAGPSGYPPDDAFEADDDFEDYPPATSYPSSGRGTPLSNRRVNVAQSMLPEREAVPGYDRPRARTEDTDGPVMRQWKNGHPLPPPLPASGGLPLSAQSRPQASRLNSNASDASFGPGVNSARGGQTLRSQFSSNKLSTAYENDVGRAMAGDGVPYTSRSRSSSQPSAYHPAKGPAPPLPHAMSQWSEHSKSSVTGSVNTSKRGSGSSQSTGDSSDYSPHSTSPITPFGSSDSSLAGSTIRTVRSQSFDHTNGDSGSMLLIKVKVHFFEDIFVIQVPRSTEYAELVEKVGKKIRLCGPRREDGPLKVKYIDEDGDMISLGSSEDVQMAFDTSRSGNHVTLYVQ